MKYSTHKALSCFHFSSSSSFGKCARLGSKKFLSVFFVVIFLLSCFSISSFAADETGVQTFDILSMSPSMYRVSTDGNTMSSYDSSIVTQLKTFKDGTECVNFTNSNSEYYASGMYKAVILTDYISINPDTQYSISFKHSLNYEALYEIHVYVVVYSGSHITKIPIYTDNFHGNYYNGNVSDFSFKVSSSDFGNSYKCRLYIEQYVDSKQSWTGCQQIIQRYISVENDDVTWFSRILNAIKAIPSNISSFFSTLGDRISGFFDVLNSKIQTFSDSVTTKFNEIRLKIENFYLGVKQWFQDLGDRIQQFFVDLYNDIVEGLKSLFIPSDGYFESKKTELENFCLQHFGALYQAPDVILDLVNKFVNLTPKQPSITLPAIQFDFNGTRYVLSDAITYSFSWVNDSSHPLFYFYKFYRGFATLFLFFFFGDFCIKKYNEVFAGGDPD